MAATLCVFRAEYEKKEEEKQEEREGEATYNRNKNQELFINKTKNITKTKRNTVHHFLPSDCDPSQFSHYSIINIGLFFFFFFFF